MKIVKDAHGFPILLSDIPGVKVPANDPPAPKVSNSTSDEVARRRDAVREAAREIEDLTVQDLKERLKGVTNRELEPHELAEFEADVRAQVVDDLIDVLHQAQVGRLRGRRTLKLQASRGWTRKNLHSRTDDELKSIGQRLRARGWTDDMIDHGYASRLSSARLVSVLGKL